MGPVHEVPPHAGQVARWNALLAGYPEAGYTFDGGLYYGALRHADGVIRSAGLGRLIDALLAREGNSGARPGDLKQGGPPRCW